ncbi:MAG: PQQ-binding-like beta-propeller repeat protein [Gemmatimonadota bacterium]
MTLHDSTVSLPACDGATLRWQGAWIVAMVLCVGCGDRDVVEATAGSSIPIEWTTWGGDAAQTRFSPAHQIDTLTVSRLRPAWRWTTGERPMRDPANGERVSPGKFEATPLMIGDTLFLSTPFHRVVALDANTGEPFWIWDPTAWRGGSVGGDHAGFVHRGVATSVVDGQRRIYMNTRGDLVALEAATGILVPQFGRHGRVDLTAELEWPVKRADIGGTSPPAIWNGIVVVGSSISDKLVFTRDPPGDVQAFDARTGARLWRWHPIPAEGDPARRGWTDASARSTGQMNTWAPMSIDTLRGLIYLPTSSPSNDFYGGTRPGDNRWASSVVCLDLRTGTLVWAQQLVHHGLWDYDIAAAPLLLDLALDGPQRPVVVVAGKTGWLYLFDRVTGEPLWPIEERAVPASSLPGEWASPTQPHPGGPPPFVPQSLALDDALDLTPALARRARAVLERYELGPIFLPPSRDGSVSTPGWIGGAGWGALAADPRSGTVFVKGTHQPTVARVVPRLPIAPGGDTLFIADPLMPPDAPLTVSLPRTRRWGRPPVPAVRVPAVKPPWGNLTAVTVQNASVAWQVPFGERSAVNAHPHLRDVDVHRLGVPGAPGGVVTAGGLLFGTGGGDILVAVSTRTGAVTWSWPLGQVGYSNPMTYQTRAGRQFVVIATGEGAGASLQAFTLEKP